MISSGSGSGSPASFTLYDTGVDDTGTPLADGSVDPHYTITAAPSPYTAGSAYVVDQTSFPLTGNYWIADSDNLSKWIGPVANESNDPSGDYTYQTTFDLTGLDPSTAAITGNYATDDWLYEIILNGQVVDTLPTGGTSEYGAWQTLPTINSGFVAGLNTLDFVVENRQQSSGNPTGLRVEMSGTADKGPAAYNDSYSLLHDSTLSVPAQGVLSNDTDSNNLPLSAVLVSGPSDGTLSLQSDGSFTYTPNAGYVGSDSFQYYATDGQQNFNIATVSLTVTDQAPVANDDSYSILHDQELDVDASDGVLANDTDADGDSLTASLVSGPSNGTLTFNPDGSFTYTPNAGWTGSDTFTYTASDGTLTSNTATVTISVTDPNAPVANNDSYDVERNNEFSNNYSTGVLANDTDADGDTLSASTVSGPTNGTLTLNPDGSFDYTPNQDFTGTDSFTYTASDGVLTSNTATVTLTVTASPPSAADQSLDVLENNTLNAPSGTLMLGDSNPDNMTLTAQDVTQPSDGSVTVNSDGSFTYTPNNDFTGTDSFTYDVTDGTLTSDPATVTIDVTSTNTPPTAGNLSYSVDENTSLSSDSSSGVLSAASDSDGDTLIATLYSGPSNGTLSLSGDGSFTYTPNTDFYGTDSFQYEAFDGTYYSSPATATITVNEDVPTAVDDSYSVLASGPMTVTAGIGVLANDSDSEGTPLTAVLETQPTEGSVTLNSDGSFTYTPGSNFTGTDSFTYEAYNGLNYSTPATVSLTTDPVAASWSYSVTHDQTLTETAAYGLLNGASDAEGDSLTAALATGPSDGTVTVNSDGSFTYIPATHFVGTDSFTYTVSNGSNTSAPATVTISVINNIRNRSLPRK